MTVRTYDVIREGGVALNQWGVRTGTPSPEYPDDMLAIIKGGLPQGKGKKKILIIGAGLSGLVSASLLKKAGHEVTILEGNNRLGGRVYTKRSPFSKGNYLDMGAMRIPDNHRLVMEYIRMFNLPTNPFLNTTPYDKVYVNGVYKTVEEYENDPDILGFPLNTSEKGKTAEQLFIETTKPFIDAYQNGSKEERKRLIEEFSNYSMGRFLRESPYGNPLSLNAIRMISVLLGIEGFPEFSFADILTDIIYPIFRKETKFNQITGGNDRLPYAFQDELKDNLLMNHRVYRIVQDREGVEVFTRNGESGAFRGDFALVTVPFTVLQTIDIEPYQSISFKKWQAITELTNVPAVKVGIEFKTRFWEEMKIGNIISDLPSRFTYVPSNGIGSGRPGVLLASYSWGQNALLLNSMSKEDILANVMKDLEKFYGPRVYTEISSYAVYNWSVNPFSAGCFTLFTPGQETDFADYIQQPEGRLHFAGEHTSSFHGWMEGAIESGIRAAYELNAR
ncbi:monoamine oxidase [Rossellomorea marisflavi]